MKNFEKLGEVAIANAMLMGAEITYDDYGHPERSETRMYWSIRNCPPDAYGYTKASCALSWLGKQGYHVTLEGLIHRRSHNPTE
jgi:hypothetical protein